MDKDTHVYCTNCINLDIVLKCIDGIGGDSEVGCGKCKCHDCECCNPEDGMRFEDRPSYVCKEEIDLENLFVVESLKTCNEGIKICEDKLEYFGNKLTRLKQNKKGYEYILNKKYNE